MKNSVILLLFVIMAVSVVGCKSRKENKGSGKSNVTDKARGKAAVEKKPRTVLERIPELAATADVSEQKRLSSLKHYYKGNKLREDGKFDEAINVLIAAAVDNPGNLEARYVLALALAQKKRAGESLGILKQFGEARDCPRCFSFLAKAKRNEVFEIFGSNTEFSRLVDGPAARMKKEMAAANWIGYDKEALKNRRVNLLFQGLPAVSVDGRQIIAASLSSDKDGRVYSATLQILDAQTGERQSARRILFRPEGERILSGKMSDREAMRLLDKRIRYIHEALVVGKWVPLKLAAVETKKKLARCEKTQQFSVLDRKVSFSGTMLKMTSTETGKSIVVDGQKWLPSGNKVCVARPMIREAYVHEAHQLMLLALGFCSDDCVSRETSWAVVSL